MKPITADELMTMYYRDYEIGICDSDMIKHNIIFKDALYRYACENNCSFEEALNSAKTGIEYNPNNIYMKKIRDIFSSL